MTEIPNDSFFETRFDDLDRSMANTIRIALGVGGLLMLVIGILVLAWPGKTAVVVAGFIAVYAAIAGLVNLAIGAFTRKIGAWPRVGYIVLGVLFLVAAVIMFGNLGAAAAGLATLLAIVTGIVWIIEGIVGLSLLGDSASKLWTIIYAVLSIIAGIVLLTSPLWGALVLWMLLGISLVILGVIQIVRGFTFGSRRTA